MFVDAEEIDLLFLLVPVATDALEAPGAVGETMRTYRDDATFGGQKLAVYKEFFCVHPSDDKAASLLLISSFSDSLMDSVTRL